MRLSDSLTDVRVLTWLTNHAVDYRKRKGHIAMADKLPKIQIKGLATDVAKFRTDMQKLRDSMADLQDARTGLAQDVVDAKEQISQVRQDLRFELEQLGNGGDNSATHSETQTITTGDVAPLNADSKASIESEH